jgi:branched-subunit amino acid transport protein
VTPLVLAGIAAVTYLSRATSLVFLPPPRGRFAAVLARMPAPIFASLAALTLVTPGGSPAEAPVLCAAAGALLAAPRRSLAVSLLAGLAGYAVGRAFFVS